MHPYARLGCRARARARVYGLRKRLGSSIGIRGP